MCVCHFKMIPLENRQEYLMAGWQTANIMVTATPPDAN